MEEVIIIRVSNPNSGFMKQLERMRALEFDENASLKIDESALTGESFVVEKSKDTILAEVPLGDRTNFFNGERGKIKNQVGKYGWISLQKHWNLHPGGDTILTLKQNRRTKRCYF